VVSKKSHGKRVKVPVDTITKARQRPECGIAVAHERVGVYCWGSGCLNGNPD